MVNAQPFFAVRCEIDNDKPPARPQDARRFGDNIARRIGVMQNLMHRNGIEGRAGHWQLIHVAEPDLTFMQTRALQIGARNRKHIAR
jgi:hypothetical protein